MNTRSTEIAQRTPSELEFSTSGSTNEPVRWLRTDEQVSAEIRVLFELCCPYGIDGVVCYAQPSHLYGYLMGRALPEFLGIPSQHVELIDSPIPMLTRCRRPLVVAVPAAIAQLERCLSALVCLDSLVLVHSSAMLPPNVRRLLLALEGKARFLDLFGSTESGLIAWREDPECSDWTLASDVTLGDGMAAGAVGQLRIRSPRLGRRVGCPPPDQLELGDIVEVVDDRSFRWLERRGEVLKVNGRKVHLDKVLTSLRDAVPGVRLTYWRHPDELRGEWFTVVVETDDARIVAALDNACRALLPSWQRPRAITAVSTTLRRAGRGD